MGIGEIVILAIVVFVFDILLGITTSCLCMTASLGENTHIDVKTEESKED